MATHLFVVEAGKHRVGNSIAWSYEADSNGITFSHNVTDIPSIHKDGRFINRMVLFRADGANSEFLGVARMPKDDRLVYLWKKELRRATRSNQPDVIDQMYRRHGGDDTPSYYENGWTRGSWEIHNMISKEIKRDESIKFSFIRGRLASTGTDCLWYMAEDATIEELMSAFDEHPGYSEYTWEVAEAVFATKANMKKHYSYLTYTTKDGTTFLVVENRDGEEFEPSKLNDMRYINKFVVAGTSGRNDNFDTLVRLLDAVEWTAEKMTAEEKIQEK